MKHVIAIIVCGAIVILYGVVGALLEWEHGGGVIPMLILLFVLGVTWRAITRAS